VESDLVMFNANLWFLNLGPFYTWRTLTGGKLNNNWPQYTLRNF